jgi:hypothetical protein
MADITLDGDMSLLYILLVILAIVAIVYLFKRL